MARGSGPGRGLSHIPHERHLPLVLARLHGQVWGRSWGKGRMKRTMAFTGFLIVLLAAACNPMSAQCQTLNDALTVTYQNNPTLLAARSELRAVDELVAQAKSQRRPTVTITGDITAGWADNVCDRTLESSCNPSSVTLDVIQPVFRGGSIEANIDQADNLIRAQRASLTVTEQQVLLSAITAYLDVYRDQAVLDLNRKNEKVVGAELKATRDRFNVGAVTQTDVVQAESRAARAMAQRVLAEGRLAVSRATYREIIAEPPESLIEPPFTAELPIDEEATIAAAADNPAIIAAEFAEKAARDAVDSAFGALLPSFDLVGKLEQRADLSNDTRLGDDQNASITARLKIPLYQAGAADSRVREAKHRAGQRRNEVDIQRRAAARAAESAWRALETARAQKSSFEVQARAAELALKGVRQEADLGARTVLDILDAEQELLDAQVNLVGARRDELVSSYTVLAAIGHLTASALNLDVPIYDTVKHYDDVRGKFWGTDVESE